jgi:hypothetical protein
MALHSLATKLFRTLARVIPQCGMNSHACRLQYVPCVFSNPAGCGGPGEQLSGRRKPVRNLQRAWQERRARSWESEHRTWQQRGGYNGYRIPDDRFRVGSRLPLPDGRQSGARSQARCAG